MIAIMTKVHIAGDRMTVGTAPDSSTVELARAEDRVAFVCMAEYDEKEVLALAETTVTWLWTSLPLKAIVLDNATMLDEAGGPGGNEVK